MEKIISEEEKIRRAIEISQRRNYSCPQRETARMNVNVHKDYRLFKKMIIQIIICLLIYTIFYLISTTNFVFSENILSNTNNILSYDINLQNLYNEFLGFINNIAKDKNNSADTPNSIIDNSIVNQVLSETKENDIDNKIENEAENEVIIEEIEDIEEKIEKTSMEQDAEKVKKITKFQKPLTGTITSEFGEREVTLKGMTSDHKGIDIAANSGTSIKAAMSGTVSVAGENSEYGKFLKIVNNEVMTVYAHCKSLKVKKGDKIKIGQTIATVGSTGTSTGPHLHFEIRLSNRYINPKYVIDF